MRILVRAVFTPETSAAFSLPPMAYIYLPCVVLLYRSQNSTPEIIETIII